MRVPIRTDRPYMPDYGLSGDPDGLLPWSWAVDHLRSAHRFWVSTVDPLATLDSPQPGGGTSSGPATLDSPQPGGGTSSRPATLDSPQPGGGTSSRPTTLDSPQPGRGTSSRLATPHLSAVWAVWLDGALWFSCGPRSRKARNLLASGRCSAATERADEAVTITGYATRVEDAASIEPVSEAYLAKYGEGFPDPAENPLFAVLPDVAIGMVESEFSARATRWTFAAAEVS